ncbi:MAG: sulfite exporter TauE/SafE family protein [Crocinitomicaceae bacterium]
MELFGYLSAVLIGLILGLIGGGGSILTVPVLVYLFHIHPELGTAYSLFIVGSTSLIGVFSKIRQREVDVRTALVFGLPSLVAVFMTRKWVLPLIPDQLVVSENVVVEKSTAMMLFFAILMLFAAVRMLRPSTVETVQDPPSNELIWPLIFQGFFVGVLTGFVGVGGGFLIVPALVVLSKLPMKKAIGTSLLIISINSLVGFTGDVWSQGEKMDWSFLGVISMLSIAGIIVGGQLAKRLETHVLRKGFAWFVLVMGVFILIKEIFIQQ